MQITCRERVHIQLTANLLFFGFVIFADVTRPAVASRGDIYHLKLMFMARMLAWVNAVKT